VDHILGQKLHFGEMIIISALQ